MSCIPISWKRFRKSGKRAKERESSVELEMGESEGDMNSGSVIYATSASTIPPTITLTTSDNNKEQNEEEEDDDEFGVSMESNRGWGRRRNRNKTSVTSDGGYWSQHSTSTLNVSRPRTLTETSSSSSSYHTPQGSVHNDPSPTGSVIVPQFTDTIHTAAAGAVCSHTQALGELMEKMDKLLEAVQRLEASAREIYGGERLGRSGVQTVDSIPDLSELPNAPCDTKVLLWLEKKVTDWQFLARWLGLEEHDISRIERDYSRSDREQCYQMFLKWRSVDPENYTYPVLGEALRRESMELFNEFVKEVHRVETDNTFL